MSQKKVAVIQDMSGYGRCSMTVALPLISAYGIQCCPVPTALFSNHSGYPSFFSFDFTEQMPAYIEEWKKLDIHFDAIYVGFLSSLRQMDIVEDFIRQFKDRDTLVLLDPVMGDHGKLYSTYTSEMCDRMRGLVRLADVITPNLTEACILAGEQRVVPEQGSSAELFRIHGRTRKELSQLAAACAEMLRDEAGRGGNSSDAQGLVITGIPCGNMLGNYLFSSQGDEKMVRTRIAGSGRPGTGDIFASLLTAELLTGADLETAVRRAAGFVRKCIARSEKEGIPVRDGVCFERFLQLFRTVQGI